MAQKLSTGKLEGTAKEMLAALKGDDSGKVFCALPMCFCSFSVCSQCCRWGAALRRALQRAYRMLLRTNAS